MLIPTAASIGMDMRQQHQSICQEILLQITEAPTLVSVEADMHAAAATVLDALLLTRLEVDRRSLIALKGRRAEGTCEWLVQHPTHPEWFSVTELQLL